VLRVAAAGALGAFLAVGLTMGWQYALTGVATRSLYSLYGGVDTMVPPELWASASIVKENLLYRFRWSTMNELFFFGVLPGIAAVFALRQAEGGRPHPLWLLAVVLAVYVAHLPTTMPPGGRWGDRFHSEVWFALLVLAGQGSAVLVNSWTPQLRRAGLLLFAGMQVFTLAVYYPVFVSANRPVAIVKRAYEAIAGPATVFLQISGSATLLPEHVNTWSSQWPRAKNVLLVDPGETDRHSLACALGKPRMMVLSYDDTSRTASTEELPFSLGSCEGLTGSWRDEDVLTSRAG